MLSRRSRIVVGLLTALSLSLAVLLPYLPVSGAQSSHRYLSLASATAGVTTEYRLGLDIMTEGPLGSIRVQFCANSAIIGTPCIAPNGFDLSDATLATQSGVTDFSIHSNSTSNVLVLSRVPSSVSPVQTRYELGGVINPVDGGSYFARIETYASDDASGSHVDYGGVAFSIDQNVSITTTVPPFLLFCTGVSITGQDCESASGQYVNFGEFSAAGTSTGATQMVAATNGIGGYVITMNGTTMLSGTNSIPALGVNDVSRPGTGQFGINLRSNTDPDVGANPSGLGSGMPTADYAIPNRYRFISGEIIAKTGGPDDLRKYTVSYIVNIAKDQTPGVYVSTITYVCSATF